MYDLSLALAVRAPEEPQRARRSKGAAPGQPKNSRAIDGRRSAPTPAEISLDAGLRSTGANAGDSAAASAPARKMAKRKADPRHPANLAGERRLRGPIARSCPSFVISRSPVDRDHRIGVHFRGGGEVVTKSCRLERLSVGRFFEDFAMLSPYFFSTISTEADAASLHLHRIGALLGMNVTSARRSHPRV